MASILKGLVYLHAENHVHREITAKNIFLQGNLTSSSLVVKLGELRLSTEANLPFMSQVSNHREDNYLAPEILAGEEGGKPADMWAVGVILYELLCGETPFDTFKKHQEGFQGQLPSWPKALN